MNRFDIGRSRQFAVLLVLIQTATLGQSPFPAEILEEQAALGSGTESPVSGYGVAIDGDRVVAIGSRPYRPIGPTLPEAVEFYRQSEGQWIHEGELVPRGFFGLDRDTVLEFDGSGLALGEPQANRVYVFKALDPAPPVLAAWNTYDLSPTSGSLTYTRSLTSAQHAQAAAEGWTLTVRARMVDNFGGSMACFVDFTGANNERWLLFFDLDEQGNLVVQLGGLETLTLTDNGQGWANYRTHQIVFDPATGTADYFMDGDRRNSAPWSPTPIAGLNGVRWGNGSTVGQGSMNFNFVEFRTDESNEVMASYDAGIAGPPGTVPDPASRGWTENRTGANDPGRVVLADLMPSWRLEAMLEGDPEFAEGRFGSALALEGDTLIIGSPSDSEFGSSGAAHVFARLGLTWVELEKFGPPILKSGANFGDSVALQGDTLVVGASQRRADVSEGTVHVFVRSGDTWSLEAELLTLPGVNGEFAVTSVALHGDLVVVGVRNSPSSDEGVAYLFERSGGTWSLSSELRTGPGTSFGGFGSSVATDGNLVGVAHEGNRSVHLYVRDGEGVWNQGAQVEFTVWDTISGLAMDAGRFVATVTPIFFGGGGDALLYRLNYGNAAGLSRYARKVLYHPEASASGTFDPNQAAFRYKHRLYVEETGGIRAQFENLQSLFGPEEQRLAEVVKAELGKGLAIDPDQADLGNLLLDIYYDRAVAQTILSKETLLQSTRARFGPPIGPPPSPNEFIIDLELSLLQQVLDENRAVLEGYFSLLMDDLGVDVDPPLGYQLFRRWVPGRALETAQYLDGSGIAQPVAEQPGLFVGFKDLVLLFDLLRDHGRTAADLSRLLIARDDPPVGQNPGDREAARRMVGGAQRFLLVHGSLLKSMFPGLDPQPGDSSGLREAMDAWSASLTDLSTVQQLIAGEANVLGYADDFLMLVENYGVDADEIFDSFDSFMAWLDPGDAATDLYYALASLASARASYGDYRGFQDQLREELSETSSITYRDRLRDIVGVFPDHPNYSDDPRANPGSELDQQYRSIERARLVVLKNQVEIQNLRQQIQIEIERAADIANVYIDFGNRRARIAEKIGDINATQAAANQLTDYFNPVNLVSGASIAIAVNFGVQTIAELEKAKLEAEKERLAGLEQATITGIESAATVKTLMLNMNTLAVESMDAALLLTQEANRLAGLYREKADLERELAERREELATRYFADPIHRLYADAEMIRANLACDEARKWLFFAVRALEYKWNTPFDHVYPAGGRRWTARTVFKLRNADELELYYRALANFNQLINRARTPEFDGFSVREDFFGYPLTNSIGEILIYPDPVTGLSVDAIQAFRSRLLQLQDAQGNIRIEFDTVRQIPGGAFFVGPRFLEGAVLEKGRFLDKIDYLQIKLPGQHALGLTSLRGRLTYGGTSFIRRFNVGTPDPLRPDRLRDEYTTYSTRYWFYDPTPGIQRWRFADGLTVDSVRMELAPDDRRPPEIDRILAFKERSVAATGWLLEIPTFSQGTEVLRIDELNDIEIYFSHFSAQRQ